MLLQLLLIFASFVRCVNKGKIICGMWDVLKQQFADNRFSLCAEKIDRIIIIYRRCVANGWNFHSFFVCPSNTLTHTHSLIICIQVHNHNHVFVLFSFIGSILLLSLLILAAIVLHHTQSGTQWMMEECFFYVVWSPWTWL
jgi:hypothetical protein